MAQWFNGARAQWLNGAMAQRRNGAMAQQHEGFHFRYDLQYLKLKQAFVPLCPCAFVPFLTARFR